MNAMLVFVMAAEGIFEGFLNGWYYETTNNTLVPALELLCSYIFLQLFATFWLGLLNLSISIPSFNLFSLLAGLLDSEAHIHPSVAFETSGCSSLCHICPDIILGAHRRCFASDGYLLEVIKDHVFGRSHT